jgi:hypothetical protein
MTTTNKTVLGIALAAVVLLIGAYVIHQSMQPADTQTNSDASYSSPSDTSDAALSKDSDAIDSQLNASNQDSATVDQDIQTHTQAQ